jgi:predicted transcriptional regulator YdeE
MLKIGDFSKLAQVSVKTLRHYGRLGLLKPAWIDRYTGYRYYELDQLPRLNRILALKDLGFSLEQIRHILRAELAATELRGMLRLKQAELEQQVLAEQARLARVEARLRQIEHEGTLPQYEVVLRQVEPWLVAGIRDRIPSYRDVGTLFAELCEALRQAGMVAEALGPYVGIYYDTEYREHDVDVEAAVPIPQRIPNSARAAVHVLSGAPTAACLVHEGPHETLIEAYNALTAWMQANGYRIVAPNREVYLQGAAPGVDPTRYVTEIQIPVENVLTELQRKEISMEAKIVTKPAFTVVGLRYFGDNKHGEIPALWSQLNPRVDEIQNICEDAAYGLCRSAPNDKGEFEYVAGFPVSDASQVPAGMVSRTVPDARYAVFPCTISTIHQTYRHVADVWLPQSGHKWASSPDFELYDDKFVIDDPQSVLYIYVPIT